MKLMYYNLVVGDRLWFIKKEDRFVGIMLNFDREAWSPFSHKINGEIPKFLRGGCEADNKSDYYNIIKIIFEKRQMD